VFKPSAELARLHILNAVECLLQYEPAQGKAALDRLFKDISSDYFPNSKYDARKFLANGALRRARSSLVRNLLLVLLKTMLAEATEFKLRRAVELAIGCMLEMHPASCASTIKNDLSRLFRALDTDERLIRGTRLLALDPIFPANLEDDQVVRMQQFSERLPKEHLIWLDTIESVPFLRAAATSRASRMTADDVREVAFFMLPNVVRNRVLDAYARARNFEVANEWGRVIVAAADEFTEAEVAEIMRAAEANHQVSGSFQFSKVVHALRTKNEHLPKNFEDLAGALNKGERKPDESDFNDDIPF
jgi:hypothetical protein